MKINDESNSTVLLNKDGILALSLYDKTEAQAVKINFSPGARLDTHTTGVDVFFYVLEGAAVIEIGEDKETVQKGSLVESPKGIPHAIENFSKTEPLKVLVVKAPRP